MRVLIRNEKCEPEVREISKAYMYGDITLCLMESPSSGKCLVSVSNNFVLHQILRSLLTDGYANLLDFEARHFA